MGVDQIWQDFKGHREFDRFIENEAAFIASDSFYMATVSETGWPYMQHRGGPRGFLKLVDDRTLAFADYRGNRQYISTGNLAADDRACLFLMDYARRARLKIYAHVETIALDRWLLPRCHHVGLQAKLERIFRLHLKRSTGIARSTSRRASPSRTSPRPSARCATAWPSSKAKTSSCAHALLSQEIPDERSAPPAATFHARNGD
jgi:hypothetical protein